MWDRRRREPSFPSSRSVLCVLNVTQEMKVAKQRLSSLPNPARLGCCLVPLHFLCNILNIYGVRVSLCYLFGQGLGQGISRWTIHLQERLRDIGQWLRVNGEAIYKSQPWVHQNDTSNPDVWYTRSSDASVVYAIVLGWPYGDVLRISAPVTNQGTTMSFVGLDESNLRYR